MTSQPAVSQEKWIEARKALLAKEKENTRQRDELARERRELPWVKVDKNYVFDASQGKVSLADLFGPHSQLIIYHFMFGPNWAEGCPSCSLVCDHINGATVHLAARDVSLVMVSRAPLPKIDVFKKRMGWHFPWVSSQENSFNHDFHVYFTPEERATGAVEYNYTMQSFPSDEAPGVSVFYKDAKTGDIFHTYSTFSRGLDAMVGTYVLLDMAPKGRNEDQLPFSMQWVRHHDRYEGGGFADPNKPYWPKIVIATTEGSTSCCGSEKNK